MTTTSPVIILPRFIILKANNYDKFLRLVGDEGAETARGYVQFTADTGVIPDAKFEVEAATEPGNGGLVHIRSCYNNKYWARPSQDSTWIKAWSPVKDEVDKTHWACTLFEPIKVADDDNGKALIRLRHVQLGRFASLTRTSSPIHFDFGVAALTDLPANTNQDVFRVTNWESVVILPKFIAIKGNNGKYLIPSQTVQWLYFDGDDIGDASLPVEVVPIGDGTVIHIRNNSNGRHWARYPLRGTFADSMNTIFMTTLGTFTGDAEFSPVKVNNNVIALRSVANNAFCARRLSFDSSMFRADAASITADAQLRVVEPVMRRNISVNFRFEDARIYDLEPIAMATHDSENLLNVPHTVRLGLSRAYTNTRSWDNSISLTVGVETTFTSGIPLIAEAGITVSTEINDTFTFGESHEVTDEAHAEVEVEVPPMSKVTATLMATKGRCNVPFSYIQTDVYYDGRTVSHNLHDGIFNGVNYFGFFSRVEPAVRLG